MFMPLGSVLFAGQQSLGHWRNAKKSNAWNKWAEFSFEVAQARRVTRMALLRWIKQVIHNHGSYPEPYLSYTNQALSAAFNKWRACMPPKERDIQAFFDAKQLRQLRRWR